jgi:hypothetical protein
MDLVRKANKEKSKMRFFFPALIVLVSVICLSLSADAAALPRLRVSENKRFLVQENGRPFFYLGDTAWELFHRLDRKQAVEYLDLRAQQGYTVIQAVALAELDGLTDPNPYGDLPLLGKDPARPWVTPGNNPEDAAAYDYWDHVEFIIDEANRRGLYVGLLPTWGRWVRHDRNPSDQVFNPENAFTYGRFMGQRFGGKALIWILGGDRSAEGFEEIWRAMARGIVVGIAGREDYSGVLMTYHPGGGHSSAEYFHLDPWLAFNMQQTGHAVAERAEPWVRIAGDYRRTPVKPVLDGEPLYEDHPIGFRMAARYGYSSDAHVRQRAYWAVFSGACGHTYGHHSVWQMFAPGRRPVNGPLFYWYEAIHRPGAAQMQYLRKLVESRPFLSRVPDPSLLTDPLDGPDRIVATRGDGYAFIYTPQLREITVDLTKLKFERIKAWWFNPRNGSYDLIGTLVPDGLRQFSSPALGGLGADWVLVLDDETRNFPPPGLARLP